MDHAPAKSSRPLPRNVCLLIGMRAARSVGQGAMVAAFTLYLHALGWSGTAIGAVLMGALLVAMPLLPWFWPAMAVYIARGATNRGTGGVRQALAVGLTRVERRGLASSLQNISIQLPRAIGPAIGGALFHAGYLTLPFLLGAALQLGYLLLYTRFFSHMDVAQARES